MQVFVSSFVPKSLKPNSLNPSMDNGVALFFFTSFLLLQVSFIHSGADSSSSSSSSCSNSNNKLPLVKGLSWSFYQSSCPNLNSLIRTHLNKVFTNNIGLAAGLLRLHFHDCFVQGCDGSVLLDGSASGPSEKEAPPNLSLRAEAFKIIEELRALVHHHCGNIVSCADIVAVAARDAVFLSGGPEYEVPLGRRDGLTFATRNATLANLPAPTSNAIVILESLATKGFDPTDVVALSGGHTIGISHCASFTNRLYPNQDPVMDKTFADNLKLTCPTVNTNNTTVMDLRTPDLFDNKYYVGLVNRQGLFTSDQDLFTDQRTKEIVREFAENQSLFFEKFAEAMVKMGQLGVLTGNNGEIRGNCSVRNQDYESFLKMYEVEEDVVEDRSEL